MDSAVQFELRVPSDMSEALPAQNHIVELMQQRDYSARDLFAVRLAVEEALTNAIRHGNKEDRGRRVTIHGDITNDRIRVVVSDEGEGFIPADVPDPTLPEYIERTTGRGLILMRAYLDLCEYNSSGNQITMERRRNSPLPILED